MTEKYKLISNDPIGEDQFESKGQEKTATIIANHIDNEKFKVIGIDGGWGSGKSNLIKILEGILSKHSFFVYDVWGHQEDEQRKAILTELTDFIIKKRIVRNCNKKKWQEKLRSLLASKRETIIVNNPHLSVGSTVYILSLIFIPIIIGLQKLIGDVVNVPIYLQVILLLAPLIVLIIVFLINIIKGVWIYSFKKAIVEGFQETVQIYKDKERKKTKLETVSEDQPSVRDFRNWMKDIDKDLNNKKLIIVFDNFDRLPKKQILSIWSVIHVFFSDTKYKNIKIVVPFDRAHINNAFRELNGNDEENFAKDYINKTFDIVYRVAPPILSSWKSFFEEKWQEAFSENYKREEYLKSLQAYEVLRPIITPREIIAFINEVVALKLIDETIPNRYISIFVLKKEEIISDPLRAVINLEYLEGIKYAYINDPDYQKYITALAYQIDSEKALEVVYRRNLKSSLINGDKEKLNEISKTNVFSSLLQSVILNIDNYEKPVETLNSLSEEALISEDELSVIWNDIYLQQKSNDETSGKLAEFQTILLKKINDKYKPKWLKTIINNLYCEESNFTPLDFIAEVDILNVVCTENNIDLNVYSYLSTRTVNIDDYISIVNEKKDKHTKYKLVCPKSTVIPYLNELTSEKLEFHEFVFHLDYKFELDDFCELIKSFIIEKPDNSEYIQYALSFLKNISKEPIGQILNDAQLYLLVNRADAEDEFLVDLACMRVLLVNSSHQSYKAVYDKLLTLEDEIFHKKVAQEIEHFITLDNLLIKSIDFQNNLIEGVIPKLFELESEKRVLDVNNVLENITAIVEANKIDAETIFSELNKYEFEKNLDSDFVRNLDVEFFRFAKESNTDIAKYIISIYLNYFKKLDNEIWRVVFSNLDSKELSILLLLNFKDWNSFSLENFKIKLLDISNSNDNNISRIPPLIDSLEKSNQNLILAFIDMRESYISNNNISNEHFSMFMPYLFKYGKLEEKAADIIRTVFKSAVLDDPNCVSVMIEYSEDIKNILDECEKSEKIDFISAIKDRSKDEQISELAVKLNIKTAKQE